MTPSVGWAAGLAGQRAMLGAMTAESEDREAPELPPALLNAWIICHFPGIARG